MAVHREMSCHLLYCIIVECLTVFHRILAHYMLAMTYGRGCRVSRHPSMGYISYHHHLSLVAGCPDLRRPSTDIESYLSDYRISLVVLLA